MLEVAVPTAVDMRARARVRRVRTMQGRIHAAIVVLVLLVVSLACFASYSAVEMSRLNDRVQLLEWACTPVNTGGGVEQCLQPNVEQTPGVQVAK